MEYLALYRKYRPNSFNDVVGQEEIVKVIKNAIKNNKISHAYLFSGPRGTGKTTTAKIIAKMINCEHLIEGNPCDECESCINISNNNDIVEIDAASNNGVDEIRELRNKINLVPAVCKYKVYIIDEVHMLTIQAFNALLKTLEEPPSHAIFILATTEPYKIPLTVASRCQKFQFSKISNDSIVKRLKQIALLEKINVTEEILYEIARLSDGGLRDAINLFDQLIAYDTDKIELEDVYKINSTVSYKALSNLLLNMSKGNNELIIEFVEYINNEGKNISKLTEELIIFLKDILLFKNSKKITSIEDKNNRIKELSEIFTDEIIYDAIMELNELLNKIKNSSYPNILLVVTLLKIQKNNFDIKKYTENQILNRENESNLISVNKNETELKKEKDKPKDIIQSKEIKNSELELSTSVVDNSNKKVILDNNIKEIRINNALATASKTLLKELKDNYNLISNYLIDDKFNVVSALLNDTEIVVAGNKNIILMSKMDSVANRINEVIDDIQELLKKIYNKELLVVALSELEWQNEKNKYISNLKKNIKYEYIEEKVDAIKSNNNTSVDRLVDLFGEELIEYK